MEHLDSSLANAGVPHTRLVITGTRHEDVLVLWVEAKEHHVTGVAFKGIGASAAGNVPHGTRHIAATGDDVGVVKESAA